MKKIRAFTIIELVVVMVISGIAISIAGLSYDIINMQMLNYETTSARLLSTIQFNHLLKTDFIQAKKVIKEQGSLKFVSENKNEISYYFDEDNIIRRMAYLADTFQLSVFNVKQQLINEVQKNDGDLVDELSFQLTNLEHTQYFHYYKTYGADVLMEYTE